MDELLPPKRKTPSPRALRRMEQKALAEAEEARRYVESRGGHEAFEREMRALARKHGGTYGLPRVPPAKPFVAGKYFETERPLEKIEPIEGAVQTREGILALEFKAFRNATIKPGDHLAYLSAHAPDQLELPLYQGRYQRQETTEPKPKEVKK
ncbi:MAG: hypothetical protein AB1626_02720 [Candidatus Micrarchaeota archaeon]